MRGLMKKPALLYNKIMIIRFIFLLFWIMSTHHGHCQGVGSWPVFRGNQQLTGNTATELPSHLQLLWTFQTNDNIKSAPVIENHKIIVGSTDGIVYCLDFEGRQLWK